MRSRDVIEVARVRQNPGRFQQVNQQLLLAELRAGPADGGIKPTHGEDQGQIVGSRQDLYDKLSTTCDSSPIVNHEGTCAAQKSWSGKLHQLVYWQKSVR